MLNDRIRTIQRDLIECSLCYRRYVDHLCRMMCGVDQENYMLPFGPLEKSKNIHHGQIIKDIQITLTREWVQETIAACSEHRILKFHSIDCQNESCYLISWLKDLWNASPAFRPFNLTYKMHHSLVRSQYSFGFHNRTPDMISCFQSRTNEVKLCVCF